jgi:hypothetical protein
MTAVIKETPSVLEVKPKAGAALRISNTISIPKVVAVILRLLGDEAGRPFYGFEEKRAAGLFGSPQYATTG